MQVPQIALTKVFSILILSSLLLITNGTCSRQLFEAEKLSMKTIKTEYGDIYDCIDFYKQPAFDHPLLKNHNYHPQMKPSFYPSLWRTTSNLTMDITMPKLGLKDGGCPSGTVPIRRVSDEDRIQAKILSQTYASTIFDPLTLHPKPGTHYAVAQTETGPGLSSYHGVGANLSAYNPTTDGSQYSSGQIMVQDGVESMQVGWMVHPTLYKDKQTRMFIYTNAREKQCFNTYCSGFVLMRTDLPVDIVLDYSIPGGRTYVYSFYIVQDTTFGNWWLLEGQDHFRVGFWPKQIFSGLSTAASYVACGGGAYSGPRQLTPVMGSGFYPIGNPKFDAFCANYCVLNDKFEYVIAKTEIYSDNDGYQVVDDEIKGSLGHLVYYGGPGGRKSNL